jgi:hypothetical protein
MKIVSRFFFIVFARGVFAVQSMQLQMDAFNVGQGNFIILHNSTHALIVDCGCTSSGGRPLSYYVDMYAKTGALYPHVKDILYNRRVSVIITQIITICWSILKYRLMV